MAQFHVTDAQAGQLRSPKASLYGSVQHGLVSSPCPGVPVGGVDEGVDLGLVEIAHLLSLATLGRYFEDPGDHQGVLGVA